MPRQTSTSRGVHAIDLPQDLQPNFPRRKMEETPDLPLHDKHSVTDNTSRCHKNLVHLIPVVVLLCLFILWWFSYPVNVVIKNGRITAVERIEMLKLVNVTNVHIAPLSSIAPPYPSIPDVKNLKNDSIAQGPNTTE